MHHTSIGNCEKQLFEKPYQLAVGQKITIRLSISKRPMIPFRLEMTCHLSPDDNLFWNRCMPSSVLICFIRIRLVLFPPKNIRRRDVRARLSSFLSFAFVVFLSVYIFQPWRECRSLDVSAMGIWCLTTLEKRTRFSRGIRSSRTRSLVNLPKR